MYIARVYALLEFFSSCKRKLTCCCSRENVKIPPNVIDQLTSSARSDIRQVLNMLSTYFLSAKNIDYDQGKALYVNPVVLFSFVFGGIFFRSFH